MESPETAAAGPLYSTLENTDAGKNESSHKQTVLTSLEEALDSKPDVSKIVIRRATVDDAEVLARIGAQTFCETFGHMYPPEDLAQFLADAYGVERTKANLEDPAKAAWLVEAEGQAVGHALAGPCGLPHPEVTPRCGELKRFYLARGWQNGGLGKRLFAAVMDWLEAPGPRNIWIGVWSENYGAQRFYGRFGFEKVGEYGFEVGGTVDREFILRRRLAQTDTAKGAGAM